MRAEYGLNGGWGAEHLKRRGGQHKRLPRDPRHLSLGIKSLMSNGEGVDGLPDAGSKCPLDGPCCARAEGLGKDTKGFLRLACFLRTRCCILAHTITALTFLASAPTWSALLATPAELLATQSCADTLAVHQWCATSVRRSWQRWGWGLWAKWAGLQHSVYLAASKVRLQ